MNIKKLLFIVLTFGFTFVHANTASTETNALQGTMTHLAEEVATALDDAAITTAIVAQYARDPLLTPLTVSVSTSNGVVTLSGNVDSNTQYDRAEALATKTLDVKEVNTRELKVIRSQQPFTDTYITAKVKGLLFKDEFDSGKSSAWDIHVETRNGVVYLTGEIDPEDNPIRITDIARSVRGVKNVVASFNS